MNTTHRIRASQLPGIARLCLRQVHGGKKPKKLVGFQGPEGHGENIWVFSHRRSDQIIYSFKDKLDGFHDLKQLPYNGKKSKPAKLRKDYWAPMAKIEFPKGSGSVGRTVFQKLRELKHLHEVAWDNHTLYKQPLEYTEAENRSAAQRAAKGQEFRVLRNKAQRAKALNAQKANSVADIAAVLAGAGPGNKIKETTKHGTDVLMSVTVNWTDVQDMGYAELWSENVTHTLLEEEALSARTDLPAEAEAAA